MNANIRPERVNAHMTLHVQIERDFGDVKITYGLSGVYGIGSFTELTAAYDELRAQVENQHELSQKNRPALMPAKLKSNNATNQAVLLCTIVQKDMIDGKMRIRLKGGEFSTHGVAVYPEFFEALKIYPDALQYGENPYHEWVLIQLDNNGNPKKAVSIVEETAKPT